ncbi:MAG TPA: hypothetical protein VGK63_01845 [Candidatus Limnocylindrales bacterium]
MDLDAHEPGVDRDGLAAVDPHPDAHLAVVRPGVLRERELGVEGGGDRVRGALEGREHGIALAVDLDAVPAVDGRADQVAMLVEHARKGRPQHLGQSRRSLDVGEQERDRSGLSVRAEPVGRGLAGRPHDAPTSRHAFSPGKSVATSPGVQLQRPKSQADARSTASGPRAAATSRSASSVIGRA